MNRYTAQTLPEGGFLVVSAEPDLLGNALVPGEVCPCPDPVDRFTVASRTVQDTRAHCGIQSRVTTTTYTKDTFPGGTPEEEAVWDAAPSELVKEASETNTGPDSSLERKINGIGTEWEPCGYLGDPVEVWEPGAPEDYAPVTYTPGTPVVEETNFGNVGFGGFPAFDGGFDVLDQSASASKNEDSTESFGYASQWYWRLDLSAWPTGRDWPTGFEIRGTLVWDVVIKTFQNDTPDAASFSRQRVTREYAITDASRIWESEVYTSDVSGLVGENSTANLTIERISGFEIWLPLD